MTLAVTLALCSLLFTAANDLVFKLYADRMRSLGGFMTVIGLIGAISVLLISPLSQGNLQMTLIWGCIGGFFSFTGNVLLINSMKHQSAGLCSTMYRLNMIFVILGAFFLLHENVSHYQWIGIFFAIVAILAFIPYKDILMPGSVNLLGFIMAFAACLLRAGMGLSYKYGISQGADKNAVVLITELAWLFGGPVYILCKEKNWSWYKDKTLLIYAAISGILVTGVVLCMAGSLHAGDASRVLPIAQMSFLITFVLSVIFLHEKCTISKIVAITCGCISVFFLAFMQ